MIILLVMFWVTIMSFLHRPIRWNILIFRYWMLGLNMRLFPSCTHYICVYQNTVLEISFWKTVSPFKYLLRLLHQLTNYMVYGVLRFNTKHRPTSLYISKSINLVRFFILLRRIYYFSKYLKIYFFTIFWTSVHVLIRFSLA